jgi:pyruvate, orthophosphate dikinase
MGEDVVAGVRNAMPLAEMADLDPVSYDRLLGYLRTLEHHYRDLCDIEFTIERGKLWMLQTRVGESEFFSFGTNDLTQTTWGFSRDVEAAFFASYLDQHIFETSPFEPLDREGVGRLVQLAVTEGRAARPGRETGVCGEHGGDPDSVHFFHDAGLDYVSCSPFRDPIARLEAGRAALTVE